MTTRIEVYKGTQILPYVRVVAEMRLKTFCEFPYLYVGNREEELGYVEDFASTPQGLLVVVFKGEQLVGFVSGLPLNTPNSFLEHWSKKLSQQGVNISNTFYAAEIIVEPCFQKQRYTVELIKRFFEEVEKMEFPSVLGVTSIRSEDHPLRPHDYVDTDGIWEKIGFKKIPIILSAVWPTRQANHAIKRETNNLACWIKEMNSSAD